MNNTQLSAIAVAGINLLVAIVNGTGAFNITAEMVANMNGFLVPMILLFIGNKADKIEAKAGDAATTAKRVEAAQPASGGAQ